MTLGRFARASFVVLIVWTAGCKKRPPATPVGKDPSPRPLAALIAERVGVPACDEYLVKYETCILKAPPAQLQVLKVRVETLWHAWKTASEQAETKKLLPKTCERALATAKQTLAELKCTW